MNNRNDARSPNKQLVPLVRQDYITRGGGLFEAQFASGCKTTDISSIHPLNYSSMGDSRLEFSKFLYGTNRLPHQDNEGEENRPSLMKKEGKSPITTMLKADNPISNRLGKAIIEQNYQKDHSISLERGSIARSGDFSSTNKPRGSLFINDYPDHKAKDFDDDSEIKENTSLEKEVDISTYIREQRKLIKRVKSGSKIPLAKNMKDSSVHYEIKEFKRPTIGLNRDAFAAPFYKTENNKEDNDGTEDKFMRQFGHPAQANSHHSNQKQERQNMVIKFTQIGHNPQFKTYDDRGSSQFSNFALDKWEQADQFQAGKSSRTAIGGYRDSSAGSRVMKRIHINHKTTFEEVFKDEVEAAPKMSLGDTSDDKTQASVGNNRYSKPAAISKGTLLLPRDLSKKPQPDRATLKLNRCNTTSEFDKRDQSECSLDLNRRLSPAKPNHSSSDMLFVGEDGQSDSLASHFRKKIGKADSIKLFQKPKASTQEAVQRNSPTGRDNSKVDLRKKMMEYGKRIERSKRSRKESLCSDSRSNLNMSKASSNPNLMAFGQRKASPKPEVLERLARGIKPKVERTEIHEITRRHIEKFQKLNKQPDTPQATLAKKAELMERRNKVKELDLVETVYARR